ncbi:MAG: fumarate hydratase [Treponema sp.]|nr:fumarate hydratase [Treponema sp.]
MREINVGTITDLVSELCIRANCDLNKDIEEAFQESLKTEESPVGRDVLQTLISNAQVAREEGVPICQDTGMAVIYIELGMEVHLTGGDLEEAIQEGVRQGYARGYLRNSVVKDPIRRQNTNDNTPAVIHYSVVGGDRVKIIAAPKGAGSENMSTLKMLTPSAGLQGLKSFVVESVSVAGANPCPPVIVGVGVGGTMEKAALLAKKALLRPLGSAPADAFWGEVEAELLESINALGIGPGGFGGRTTALGVHIEPFATHIACLPAAVNMGCHVTRHSEGIL